MINRSILIHQLVRILLYVGTWQENPKFGMDCSERSGGNLSVFTSSKNLMDWLLGHNEKPFRFNRYVFNVQKFLKLLTEPRYWLNHIAISDIGYILVETAISIYFCNHYCILWTNGQWGTSVILIAITIMTQPKHLTTKTRHKNNSIFIS